MPMAWPTMVASRMPVSVTRSSPYFACRPANPWLTSPSLPTSSPKAISSGYAAEGGVEAGVDHLEAVHQRRVVGVRRRHRRDGGRRPRALGVELRAVALLVGARLRLAPRDQLGAHARLLVARRHQRVGDGGEDVAAVGGGLPLQLARDPPHLGAGGGVGGAGGDALAEGDHHLPARGRSAPGTPPRRRAGRRAPAPAPPPPGRPARRRRRSPRRRSTRASCRRSRAPAPTPAAARACSARGCPRSSAPAAGSSRRRGRPPARAPGAPSRRRADRCRPARRSPNPGRCRGRSRRARRRRAEALEQRPRSPLVTWSSLGTEMP